MKNNIILTVVIAIIVGAGGFFSGMKYQQGKQPAFSRQAGAQAGRSGGQLRGNRPVMGQIISQDDKSITVKMQDGSTKIVILSATTTYNQAAAAAKSDLQVGESVGVYGQANSDGSVTAQNIQLNPQSRATTGGTLR